MQTSILEQMLEGHAPDLERLSVSQFHQMIRHGVLCEGQPVELIDGLLVRKNRSDSGGNPMIHGPRHALCVKRLQRLDRDCESKDCHLHCQLPVTLSEDREPEPDAAVVRGTAERYAQRHPGPADLIAVIEVADSSLEYDRSTKQRVYAEASVPVYWIVNIRERQIEVYEAPDTVAGCYQKRTDVGEGGTIQLAVGALEMIEIAVADLLP